MSTLRIFIVEDDPWFGELLKHHLELNPDYTVNLFQTAQDCLKNLHLGPSVICTDYGLPDMNGAELMKKIQAIGNNIPVIVISAQEDISVAVELLKAGARDYIVKGEKSRELLWNAILRLRENLDLKKEVEDLKGQLEQKYSFGKFIIGKSTSLMKVFKLIEKAAGSSINVSISGETGTGKEVVAKAIHYNSPLRKQPFVAVNMGAIPSELIESELFGHEKGAFTGADARRKGRFEDAGNGTIFLDEIVELDLNLQSKLLRVLQEREVVRVGGSEKIPVNARLITASHKNLADEVKAGRFREDLFYRVIGLPIELPPLRDRGDDVLILARHFADEYSRTNKTPKLTFAPAAYDKLMNYGYPGNVRELKSIIELACVMSDGTSVSENDVRFTGVSELPLFAGRERSLKDMTEDIIRFYLNKYDQDVMEVAKRLEIGKSTIYNLLKKDKTDTPS